MASAASGGSNAGGGEGSGGDHAPFDNRMREASISASSNITLSSTFGGGSSTDGNGDQFGTFPFMVPAGGDPNLSSARRAPPSAIASDISSLSDADVQAHLMHLQRQGVHLYGGPELMQSVRTNAHAAQGAHFPADHAARQHDFRPHDQYAAPSAAMNASSSSSSSQQPQRQPSAFDFHVNAASSSSPLSAQAGQQNYQMHRFDPSNLNFAQNQQLPHRADGGEQQHLHQTHQQQNLPYASPHSHMQEQQQQQQQQPFQSHSQNHSQEQSQSPFVNQNSQTQHEATQFAQFGERQQHVSPYPDFTQMQHPQAMHSQEDGLMSAHGANGAHGSLLPSFHSPHQGSTSSRQQHVAIQGSSSSGSVSDIVSPFQQQQGGQHSFLPLGTERNASALNQYGDQSIAYQQGQQTDASLHSSMGQGAPFRGADQQSQHVEGHQQQPTGLLNGFGHSPNLAQLHTMRQQQQSPYQGYDLTDQNLSAALATNAQISSSSSVDAFRIHSQQQNQTQQQGNTTPTIMEEDEQNFMRHSPHQPPFANNFQQQQQQYPHRHHPYSHHEMGLQHLSSPTSSSHLHPYLGHAGPDMAHHPSVGGLGMVVRRSQPHLRPNIFQQYSNMNLSPFEDMRYADTEDCLPFIDEVILNYIATPSRLGMGERTVMVMASKVAQKSYGAEKRFLCPPPMALLVGSSWWSACRHPGANSTPQITSGSDEAAPTVLTPPRVSISLSGDAGVPAQEGALDWASSSGKLIDTDNPSSEFAISGRSIGRHLFINDSDEKRRHCEALFHITVPTANASDRRPLGVFASKPIKVISKPSKKRQSTRNSELGVNHGSTISLFHRLRSQTVSTRYLCVSGAPTWFKGSDGIPFLNTDANTHIPKQGESPSCFVAKTSSWDPFIVYLVDPHMNPNDPSASMSSTMPHQNKHSAPSRPSHYPSPPINALPFSHGNTPIHYNQPIVLQCLNTAVVSPVMVIRKADRGTTVVGSGHPMAAFGPNGPPPGDSYGEPVSQLHKIALEILEDQPQSQSGSEPVGPGQSGHFLGCLNEDVGLRKPLSARQWTAAQNAGGAGSAGSVGAFATRGRSDSQSRPSTPTTPVTPMTALVPASISSAHVNAGPSGGHAIDSFKVDLTMSPASVAAAYAPSHPQMMSGVSHGGNSEQQPQQIGGPDQGGYPYNVPPSAYAHPSSSAEEPFAGGKVKRPRRVSSSSLMPQKDRTGGVAGKNTRRRGQSLSVVGLQNQLYAQQQQKEQQQAQAQAAAAAAAGGGVYSGVPGSAGLAGSRSTSSSSSLASAMPSAHPTSIGTGTNGPNAGTLLRRTNSFANSLTNSEASSFSMTATGTGGPGVPSSIAPWTVEVHDSDVWTIVGVDIARHTFYLPPKLVGGSKTKAEGVDSSISHLVTVPAPARPITPLPVVFKYAGGGHSAAAMAKHSSSTGSGAAIGAGGGGGSPSQNPTNGHDYVTLLGAHLTPDLFVYFGDWRSTQVSVANSTTIFCTAPPPVDEVGLPRHRCPITLVRRDGVIFPTDCIYKP